MSLSKLWRHDRALGAIMALVLLLGLIYNFVILPGFGPDETRHFAYTRLMVEERRFPLLLPNGEEYKGAHSLHPPVYHLLAMPLYLVGSLFSEAGQYHIARLTSLLLCLGSLPFIYEIAWRAGNGNRTLARFAVAIVGLSPIFVMTCGILNNDAALLFFVTLFVYGLTVRYAEDKSVRSAVILGVIFSLGALSKATAILCDGVALMLYLWLQNGKNSHLQAQVWKRLAVFAVVAVVLCAPWFLRNHSLYGSYQVVPTGYSSPALPAPSNGALVMLMHPNFVPLFGIANRGIFNTTWAQRDWLMQRQSAMPGASYEPVQGAIYLALTAFVLVACVGHVVLRRRAKAVSVELQQESPPVRAALFSPYQQRLALILPYAVFGVSWVACLQLAMFVHWGLAEGGRYLFPAVFGLAIFIARGYEGLLGASSRFVLIGWTLFGLALNSVCIYWLLSYLNPTYGPPR